MAKPTDTVWAIEPHTKAKHSILRGHLDAWLPIMSTGNRRITYIDAFAGPGVYAGGEPGSPILALLAFLEHRGRARVTAQVNYVFIEQAPDRIERLKHEVAKLGPLPTNVKVDIREGVYEEVFGQILDEAHEKGESLGPTFAFIDPFGYAQASMKLSGRFLQFGKCEALIYVPLPFIARFVGEEGQEAALNSFFGTDEWKAAIDLEGDDRQRFLHDLFQKQLRVACGLKFVRSFEIVTKQRTGYHLFFGTNSLKGLEKMKESMWRIDPVEGERFVDSTSSDPAQQTLFEPKPDMTQLRKALMARYTGVFSSDEAKRFALVETPYLPKHVRQTLMPLEKTGELEIVSTKPGRRIGDYPPGTRMRFAPKPS